MKKKIHSLVKNFYALLTYLCLPISLILRLIGVRVLDTKHEAIGHLSPEPDIYLREQKLKKTVRWTVLFPPYRFSKGGWPKLDVSNRYLLKCWEDHFILIQNPILHFLLYPIFRSPLLRYDPSHYFAQRLSHLYRPGSDAISIYDAYEKKYGDGSGYKPLLKLKPEEMEKGRAVLREMGLSPDDWYVCFNCREAGYYSEFSLHSMSVRNAEIERFELVAKEIINRGGWCIRMGSPHTKKLPDSMNHERIIDYPHTKWVSDFMDIFLLSECRFFIGTNSGLTSAAGVLGVPCVLTNVVPFGQLSFYPKDLVIFKVHRKKGDQKWIPFSHCLNSFLSVSIATKDYEELDVEVVENTKEEILDVCKEMLERLDGTDQSDTEDRVLQERFHSLMNSYCLSYRSPAKVGRGFLRNYKSLL